MFKKDKWKFTWKSSVKIAHTYLRDFALWDILISQLLLTHHHQKQKDATEPINFFRHYSLFSNLC